MLSAGADLLVMEMIVSCAPLRPRSPPGIAPGPEAMALAVAPWLLRDLPVQS